jgi:hypothetical protein
MSLPVFAEASSIPNDPSASPTNQRHGVVEHRDATAAVISAADSIGGANLKVGPERGDWLAPPSYRRSVYGGIVNRNVLPSATSTPNQRLRIPMPSPHWL